MRFMYHYGLYIQVGETFSLIEKQSLDCVYSGSAWGRFLSECLDTHVCTGMLSIAADVRDENV